jgi:hypothetical protein
LALICPIPQISFGKKMLVKLRNRRLFNHFNTDSQ